MKHAERLKFINSYVYWHTMGTISFEVCPDTGYPKEPPWDRPTPIDCILVVNHGRGCIVVVNRPDPVAPFALFGDTVSHCLFTHLGPSGTIWTVDRTQSVTFDMVLLKYSHTQRQTGIQIHAEKY